MSRNALVPLLAPCRQLLRRLRFEHLHALAHPGFTLRALPLAEDLCQRISLAVHLIDEAQPGPALGELRAATPLLEELRGLAQAAGLDQVMIQSLDDLQDRIDRELGFEPSHDRWRGQ